MAQHLHMKHLDSFSFTSFSKKIYNFIILPPSNHYHRFYWLLNSSCQQECWTAFCILVVSFETTTQEYHNYKSHCTQQPQRWLMSPKKLLAYHGALNLQALKEMLVLLLELLHLITFFLQGLAHDDLTQSPLNRQIHMPNTYWWSLLICTEHTEERQVAWNLHLLFWKELLWGFFFLWTIVNKRDIHIEIYTEYFQCGVHHLI